MIKSKVHLSCLGKPLETRSKYLCHPRIDKNMVTLTATLLGQVLAHKVA